MADSRGLDQISVHLTPEQARIIDAHTRLEKALASIEIPQSGRWEKRETAISVLEILDKYLSATLDDEEQAGDMRIVRQTDQRSVLQDIISHLRQGKWGAEDPRLAANKAGAAGAAHDEALVKFKNEALALVNSVSNRMKSEGIKNHKAEARNAVVSEYRRANLKFKFSLNSRPEEINATLLESWEKDLKRRNRRRE